MRNSRRTHSLVLARCSIGLSCLVFFLAAVTPTQAREFRSFNPVSAAVELPQGAKPVENLKPVAPELVQKAVAQLMASWATPEMQAYLSKDFYDKDRLEDVIDTLVPRDAKVRILSVQGIQTLQQHEEAVPGDPAAKQRVSRVSVVVRTALEYNDSDGVLVQLPGTTEYILSFREMTGGYQR
ncbi:MAG: hypothetical protein AB8C02_16210 [Halioglobus sp.]